MLSFLNQGVRSFRHGVHPEDYKAMTRDLPLERMPFMKELVLPLQQHLGAPSRPLVGVGDRVQRGQLIAEATSFVSANLHASVTGTVKRIEPHHHPSGGMSDAIVIERDPYSPQTLFGEQEVAWHDFSPEELIEHIKYGGFVGLGGAAFPTHVKMSVPEGKHARFFIVNAAECEPYLTSDARILLEWTDDIWLGIRASMKILGSHTCYIGVEDNKPEAIEKLKREMPSDLQCEIIPLQAKYPQGAEKMLTEAVLQKEIPSGKLPIDVEVLVNNVGTVAAIGQYFRYRQPLVERVVTVTGPGIKRPANLIVPIGTKLGDVIDFCDGLEDDIRQILFGGPMMGSAQRFLDVPVLKGTSGLLFLVEDQVVHRQEYACIKCQRCVDACPVYLNPSRLGALAKSRHYDEMTEYHILDCMECGSCSYVCPSNIPLVQRFRMAKGLIREQMAREKAKESAK